MAQLKTSHKWIIVVVALIVLAVAGYFIYKSIPKQGENIAPPTDTTTSTNGLANLIAGGWGALVGLISGKPKTYQTIACDPNRPGYNTDGLYDNNCQ